MIWHIFSAIIFFLLIIFIYYSEKCGIQQYKIINRLIDDKVSLERELRAAKNLNAMYQLLAESKDKEKGVV